MQLRLFLTQSHNFSGYRAIIMSAGMGAARYPALPYRLPQIAPIGECQKRFCQRWRQGNHMTVFRQTALLRCRFGRGTQEIGQADQRCFVFQHQGKAGFVGQYVLRELGAQGCQSFGQGAVACPRLRWQVGAGTDEIEMDAFQQAQLFRIQVQLGTLCMQCCDPCKQARMQVNRILVCRQPRRQFDFDSLQSR